jgi:predicted dehydrogenase
MTIKLAVAGGNRGARFDQVLGGLEDRIELVAVCDPSEQVRSNWTEGRPELKAFERFEDMVEDPGIDAVFIATPMLLHAGQALTALNAGKHVLSEVIAAATLDECHALVETVESTGLTYMMAENYCYRREAMMIKNMADQNAFGDLTYAEGAYIHDCRDLMFNADYSRTWRANGGEVSGFGATQSSRGNGYPTHSLGPIAQWLGINRSDRLARTTTFVTKSVARQEWARSVLPDGHIDTTESAWSEFTDSATTLIETAQGRVICLRKDSASPRPHNMALHSLQGTKGAYISGRFDGEDPLVWLDSVSSGVSPANFGYKDKARPANSSSGVSGGERAAWQPLWDLSDKYEHPYWKELGEEAIQAGHGGGDYFVMYDFARAVAREIEPPIDVYDAVTWSSIFPISIENVKRNGEPLDIPDFRIR